MQVDAGHLASHVTSLLEAMAVPHGDAATVAACLVAADLDGVSSHGVGRLPFYCRRLALGLIEPRPVLRELSRRPAAVLLDAGNALGPVAGRRAMTIASRLAGEAGVGACAVRAGNHLGMMSWYVETAAEEGVVAMAFSNTPPAMAPPGGRRALLGTNPVAAAFPTDGPPVVVDMATSLVARGRVRAAEAVGAAIPAGWASGPDGLPTTDPGRALAGSLEPMGGAKGFALALMVEALTGVLAGAGVGPEVSGTYAESGRPSDVGHLFLALDPKAFDSGFAGRMTQLAAALRQAEPAEGAGPVRVPGDRRRSERAARRRDGIDLDDTLVAELDGLAVKAGSASRLGR